MTDEEFAAQQAATDNAFKAEQARINAEFQAQIDAQIQADTVNFARAQADITARLAAAQKLIDEDAAAYRVQEAAVQAQAAQAKREAEIAQAEIAKQIAETQRLSVETAAKAKSEIESAQRTSSAKIAGQRKAGRFSADRSMLSGYRVAETGPPTLGGAGNLGSFDGGLAATQTLGVG